MIARQLVRFFVLLTLWGACSAAPTNPLSLARLTVPPVGATEPAFLDDGHPVFVIHDLDGAIYVVEAVSAHLEPDAMGWCPSSRTIDDVLHGARWDDQGRYIAGPGSTDLGTYRTDPSADLRTVVVLEFVPPTSRSVNPTGFAGPACDQSGGGEYDIHPGSGSG